MKVNILFEKCDPEKAMDPSLPYTAYLVSYKDKETVFYDVTICNKVSDLFDHYYDTYKNFISLTQSNGKINPKLWNDPKRKKEKKK